MDHVIIAGDLNYRLDLPRELAEKTVNQIEEATDEAESRSIRKTLLRHDQLLRSISEKRAFPDFAEGEIDFPPTFKFDKGTDEYDSSHKQRIPAWTDRILFKPFGVKVYEYDSVQSAMHSDHRPVHATLGLSMKGKERTPGTKREKKKKRRKRRSTSSNDEI